MTHNSIEGVTGDREPENSHNQSENNWRRYFSFSTDHKVIGVQYMVTTFIFFLIGGLMAMIIRAELLTPESNVVDRPPLQRLVYPPRDNHDFPVDYPV